MRALSGLLLVDKRGGMTSHDVVARARRALDTRKIGHAGTLDPMATGLLVLGVGAATRLLTFIVGQEKTYEATIRLGAVTDTDDAEGSVMSTADPGDLAHVTTDGILAQVAALTGEISQVPSTVSAIKVAGRRAYDLARAGEEVRLPARAVTVGRFDVLDTRRAEESIDLDVVVDCSTGTYIRALARDLGAALGVGGHLTDLRRTRIGPFELDRAVGIDELDPAALIDSASAATRVLGAFAVSADEAQDLRHGKRLVRAADRCERFPAAAIDPDGALVGVVDRRGEDVKSTMNLPEEPA